MVFLWLVPALFPQNHSHGCGSSGGGGYYQYDNMMAASSTAPRRPFDAPFPQQLIGSCHRRTVPPTDTTYQPGLLRFEGGL